MSSQTDERLTNLEDKTELLEVQTQKLDSLIKVNKARADAALENITLDNINPNAYFSGTYDTRYQVIAGDNVGNRNKLIKSDATGRIYANEIVGDIVASARLLTENWNGNGRSTNIVSHDNTGNLLSTKLTNAYVASDANISGAKLADSSIPWGKLQNIDLNDNAGTIPLRDGTGCVLSKTVTDQTDRSTKCATTSFVRTAIDNLISSAPAELNTLKELSDKIVADASLVTQLSQHIDASFALKTELANKVDQSHLDASFALKTELANKVDQSHLDASFALKTELANKVDQSYLDASFATKVSLADLSGNLDDVVQHLDASYALKDDIRYSASFTGLNDFSGKLGQIRFDSNYAYFCVANPYVDNVTDPQNPVPVAAVWKKVALSSV